MADFIYNCFSGLFLGFLCVLTACDYDNSHFVSGHQLHQTNYDEHGMKVMLSAEYLECLVNRKHQK